MDRKKRTKMCTNRDEISDSNYRDTLGAELVLVRLCLTGTNQDIVCLHERGCSACST